MKSNLEIWRKKELIFSKIIFSSLSGLVIFKQKKNSQRSDL